MKTIALLLLFLLTMAGAARAQDQAWVQIEAHPTLAETEERARAYAALFPNTAAFQIPAGWYAIALGPFPEDTARVELRRMRAERLIPGDSFVTDGAGYRQRIWPAAALPLAPALPAPAAQPAAPAAPEDPPEETPAQARRSERDLDRAARIEVQTALQWEGHYRAALDAAFGPGTRRAMADWQAANGHQPTGVLTTRQRRDLLAAWRADVETLGLQPVAEAEAGIRIEMPMALVRFDRYAPPFVHYEPRGESGVRALLISQPGNQATLYGLYDILQTLEIVPLRGERQRQTQEFTITGRNEALQSYTYARLAGGAVKGFSLIWEPGTDDALMIRAAQIMRDSLDPVRGVALDETMAPLAAAQRADMLSGLDIRQPDTTHSGFFVDATGTVLTAAEGLTRCERITIGPDQTATLAATDAESGLALLRPDAPLAPVGFARFLQGEPRLRASVRVAGFPFGEVLEMPVLTRGILADLQGLQGESGLDRLEIETLDGDVGGPALNAAGAVLGLLLAPPPGPREMPANMRYIADAAAIGAFLTEQGITPAKAEGRATLPPDRLSRRAADMTVPVSCWN